MNPSILSPDSEVTLSCGKVTVKQLTWKKALMFFDMLKAQVKGLMNETGALVPDTSNVLEAIKGNAELLEWLALETTGQNSEWLEKLTLGDMAKVASKAIEINLFSIAEEIKNVRGRLVVLGQAGGVPDKSNETSLKPAT